jgi:hypothetical protein
MYKKLVYLFFLYILFYTFISFAEPSFNIPESSSVENSEISDNSSYPLSPDRGQITDKKDVSYHKISLEDIYLNSYKTISSEVHSNENKISKNAYTSVAKSLEISVLELKAMLLENPDKKQDYCNDQDEIACANSLLKDFCPNQDSLNFSFLNCQIQLSKRIKSEYSRYKFQEELHNYVLSSQAFTNGTLKDTGGNSFDIVVDLNIIDLIFFGDKMTIIKSGSPFLPIDYSKRQKEKDENNNLDDTKNDNEQDNDNKEGSDESDNDIVNSEGSDTSSTGENNLTETEKEEGFCRDPEELFLSYSIETQIIGINNEKNKVKFTDIKNQNLVSNYKDIQMGNIIPEQIKYTGGEYPDLSIYEKNKNKCNKEEKSYLQGLICIPEFCTDVVCVKIKIKTGYREVALRRLDCIECHIDRGNEALLPFIGTLGQNTPNSNPMESFFLAAMSNLFKGVSNTIYLKPKRLPFLVYDDSLTDQKKQKEEELKKSEEKSEEKNETKDENSSQYYLNRELYNDMLLSNCPEIYENFIPGEGSTLDSLEYCNDISNEKKKLAKQEFVGESYVSSTQRKAHLRSRSDTYKKVVEPFFWQLSMDMVAINKHLQDIDPQNIRETAKQCR